MPITFDLNNEINREMSLILKLNAWDLVFAVQSIQNAFSNEWLEKLARVRTEQIPSLLDLHPIYHGLLSNILNPLTVEVVELASYLKYLKNKMPEAHHSIANIVNKLKIDR